MYTSGVKNTERILFSEVLLKCYRKMSTFVSNDVMRITIDITMDVLIEVHVDKAYFVVPYVNDLNEANCKIVMTFVNYMR